MKKFILALIIFLPFTLSAHVLEINNSIGAVIHVSPDDEPIAKAVTTISLEIKDKDAKYKPELCECMISITKDQNVIFSKNISDSDIQVTPSSITFDYIFPEKGIYIIGFSGKPKNGSELTEFNLNFDRRVEKEANLPTKTVVTEQSFFRKHGFHLVLFGGTFAYAFYSLVLNNKWKDKPRNS